MQITGRYWWMEYLWQKIKARVGEKQVVNLFPLINSPLKMSPERNMTSTEEKWIKSGHLHQKWVGCKRIKHSPCCQLMLTTQCRLCFADLDQFYVSHLNEFWSNKAVSTCLWIRCAPVREEVEALIGTVGVFILFNNILLKECGSCFKIAFV